MAYNKVIYKGDVLMDITDSTVTEETLGEGVVAYGANGERIVGTNVGGSGFIDVLTLPTENIQTGMFYRLTKATIVYEGSREEHHAIYCVNELPEVGEPVTDVATNNIVAYFSVNSRTIHGYIDTMLSAGLGIPSGWYGEELFQVFEVKYGGVITDISESVGKDALCVLLERRMYFYDNGWCEAAFGYEMSPEFDIQWDGVIGDRIALDMSMLGYDQGVYFVKVSDDVFTVDELIGYTIGTKNADGSLDGYIIDDIGCFDTTTYPGAFTVYDGVVIVHSQDDLATALGIPTGIYTNGVYFLLDPNVHVSNLTAPSKITKIDEKFLPDISVDVDSLGLHSVATSGNYNDLLNRPNLNNYVTTSQLSNYVTTSQLSNYVTTSQLSNYVTTSQVQSMIANAIGSAIGGSY